MSNDNTIKMTPAEMVDYNRGVNAFLEGSVDRLLARCRAGI